MSHIKNPFSRNVEMLVRPVEMQVPIPAGQWHSVPFEVCPKSDQNEYRRRVAIDLRGGGRAFGQMAECLLDVNPPSNGEPVPAGK